MARNAATVESLDLDQFSLGTTHHLRFRVAELPDGSTLAIPVVVHVGKRRQPKVVVVAGVHGDEYEGPRAIMGMAHELRPSDLDGTVVLVPVANPLAYNARSRETPDDGLNLNRIFPGRPDGSLTERIAYTLVRRTIAPCDLAIDLHSAGRHGEMMPMSGFREARNETARRSAAAAAAFGLKMYWMMFWAPGTLSTALNELEIPAIGCEIGGLGMARPEDVAQYQAGVLRCLRHLRIMGPSLDVDIPHTVRTMEDVASSWSGLLDPVVRLCQQVDAGDLLARVLDPWGDVLGEVTAPFAGMIVHQRIFRQVKVGETVVSIGRERENCIAGP